MSNYLTVRFARLAGSLTLKNNLIPEEYALLASARRPALHILWKIHIQGHLSSIHIAEQLEAVSGTMSETPCCESGSNRIQNFLSRSDPDWK
jgi:hypothetical protein